MIKNIPARSRKCCLGRLVLLSALMASVVSAPAFAQGSPEAPEEPKPAKIFASDQTLEITLIAPWRDIIRDEKNQNPYRATIKFTDNLGNANSIPLTVQRRGKTRQVVCKQPPIKLRFEKDAVAGTAFRGQKSLKLVTHCDKGEKWEQYYIKEMLAYRMYNLMTDLSFRVKPLSVNYVDNDSGKVRDDHFGFLIEDDSELAKRNDLKKLKAAKIYPDQLEATEASRFALFQLMIANVDFAATSGPDANKCCHNARLIGLDEIKNIYAVPYDFDVSGMVDAHYAVPNQALPIKKVTQRLFRGYCMHNNTLEAARQEFLAKEQAIYALVRNESRLTKRSSDAVVKYLAAYFEILRDQKKFGKQVIQKCRK